MDALNQLEIPAPPLMPGYWYLACFNPQPGAAMHDSLYATVQHEVGLPVKVEALNGKQTQNWRFGPLPLGTNTYLVVSEGVLTLNDPTGVPQGPVITTLPPSSGPSSDEIMYWTINPIEVTGLTPDCYTIQPVTTNNGDTEYYVGVQDGQLCIQTFTAGNQTVKPYWQLIASGEI